MGYVYICRKKTQSIQLYETPDIQILITPMVSSNFSLKGVSRSRTFNDSQKKANEKTNYGQQNTS
jgi:hypothetical protein